MGNKYYYKRFNIKNYKGIAEITLEIPRQGVVTLVGLNESGKTTILEAIDTFYDLLMSKRELPEKNYESMIPRSDIASFTGDIEITAILGEYGDEADLKIKRLIQFQRGKFEKLQLHFFDTRDNQLQKNDEEIKAIKNEIPPIYFYDDFLEPAPDSITCFVLKVDEQIYLTYSDLKWGKILDEVYSTANRDESFLTLLRDFDFSKNRKTIEGKIDKMGQHLTNEIANLWQELTGKNYQFKEIVIHNELDEAKEIDSKKLPLTIHSFFSQKFQERKKVTATATVDFVKTIKISIKVKNKDNSVFDIVERSKGCRWFFSFLLFTYFRKGNDSLFLLDEPGSNLHGLIQENICNKAFDKLVENCCVIYSTHSPYLINLKYMENIYTISNLKQNENETISNIAIGKAITQLEAAAVSENSCVKVLLDHIAFKIPRILSEDGALETVETRIEKMDKAAQKELKPILLKIRQWRLNSREFRDLVKLMLAVCSNFVP